MKQDFMCVIPARFGSSRLPGKPLLLLAGKPLVQWAWESATASDAGEVVIATDDRRIAAAAEGFGARVVMTRDDHPSGTDRLAEVAESLQLGDDQVVVNLQGDEPSVSPRLLNQVAQLLIEHSDASMSTLSEAIHDPADFDNPNVVKVVRADTGRALYFSRASIPFSRDGDQPLFEGLVQRHLGLYGYRAGLLRRFVGWPESALERTEKLEQLRVLQAGEGIWIAEACAPSSPGIDTQAQLDSLNRQWAGQ
ncbi:3-deoxy-manno-octulosonate cytidylyltransferase [Litorivicinus lipolyticus]|uniref:3-deoxy-manno-octulosonate cytidylyltransferase n=1 Tax=Litorivicinus lipolyticus TaxID=418701 RepID=UPI003B59CF73